MNSTKMKWALWALVTSLLAVGACAPDIDDEEPAERSTVVFDSETGTIPLPSDLALEEDGTLPLLGEGASAQADFYDYLDGLHGWLPSTPITVPIDGEIDTATLTPEAVTIFRFETTEQGLALDGTIDAGSVSFNEDTSEITVIPAETLEFGTFYGYVLTEDIKDLQGNPIVAPQPLAFSLAEEPLVDDAGNITNPLLEGNVTPEQAQDLERVRQAFQPVVQAAVAEGIDRSEIMALSLWHTANDAFIVFDPATGDIPIPNEFVRQGENGEVTLPVPDGADPLTSAVLAELNSRDGFGVTSEGWISVQGAPIDPATIVETTDTSTPGTVVVAWTEGVSVNLYTEELYEATYQPDMGIISFAPENEPFRQNKLNAGIVATGENGVKDIQGRPVKPTPAFVFLRSKHPLFDTETEQSLVEQLDNDTARQLEAARQSYQRLFLAALSLGFTDRENIAVAWAFQTDESTRPLQELRAKAVALAADGGSPSAMGDASTAETSPSAMPNVGIAQTQASFTTKWFIDPNTGLLVNDPADQPATISVFVPSDEGNCTMPYPVVIAQHGLGGTRGGAADVFANTLAAEPYCMATVTMDFPLHGDRMAPDASQSGEGFLTANVLLSKNLLLQSVVDLSVLTEVIRDNGLEEILDTDESTDLIDEDLIGYTGVSLGGTLGTQFITVEPAVNTAALVTPGAIITEILQDGSLGGNILDALPVSEGTFDYFRTFVLLQWFIETIDGWTFAPHTQQRPLDLLTYDASADSFATGSELPANQVLLQMVEGDAVIPNSTTQALASAIGVSLDDYTYTGVDHSFIGEDTAEADCAKEQVAEWLSSGFAGTASAPSAQECLSGGQ